MGSSLKQTQKEIDRLTRNLKDAKSTAKELESSYKKHQKLIQKADDIIAKLTQRGNQIANS